MLTNKQQAFVEAYIIDSNVTESAVKAGYSPRTAYSIGSENLKKPEIIKAIQESRAKAQSQSCLTLTEKRELLASFVRDSSIKHADRAKYLDIDCKLAGDYAPVKQDLSVHDADINAKWLRDDLQGAIQEAQASFRVKLLGEGSKSLNESQDG